MGAATRLVPLLLVAACAGNPLARDRLVLLRQPSDRVLGGRLVDARRVVAGRLSRVEREPRYEVLGGFIARLFRHERELLFYRGWIDVDSTLLGTPRRRVTVVFSAFEGDTVPSVGRTGIWLVHHRRLVIGSECKGPYGCPDEFENMLESDDDILPVSAWSLVQRVVEILTVPAADSEAGDAPTTGVRQPGPGTTTQEAIP